MGSGKLNEPFSKLGKEQLAWPIAWAIVRARSLKPIQSGTENHMFQKDKKTENRPRGWFFQATCLMLVILAVVQILLANRLATEGDLVRKYEVETAWLKEENQKIENEIINLSSLSNIASRSGDLAFKQKMAVIYLPRPVVVAFKEGSD